MVMLCTSILQHCYCPEKSFSPHDHPLNYSFISPYDTCLLLSSPLLMQNPQMWSRSYSTIYRWRESREFLASKSTQWKSWETVRHRCGQWERLAKDNRKQADANDSKKKKDRFWWMQRHRNIKGDQSQEQKELFFHWRQVFAEKPIRRFCCGCWVISPFSRLPLCDQE